MWRSFTSIPQLTHTVLNSKHAVPTSVAHGASKSGSDVLQSSLSKPTIVLDLDGTILHREGAVSWLQLYFMPWLPPGDAYPEMARTIQELSSEYHFIGLTARHFACRMGTRRWMEVHGLGHVPLVYARGFHVGDDSRIAFKRDAVVAMRDAGWNPVVGVGDRPSDLCAYLGADVHAYVVHNQCPKSDTKASPSSTGHISPSDPGASSSDWIWPALSELIQSGDPQVSVFRDTATSSVWSQIHSALRQLSEQRHLSTEE